MSEITDLIQREFQLEDQTIPTEEEELLIWLSDYTAYLLENRMEYLMSLMYRMDISENSVAEALSPLHPEAANITIAKLILNRQKDRIFTKGFYQQKQEGIEEDLRW